MLFKIIISAGTPGAESAALDVALRLDIPCGGFDTRGLLASDNGLTQRYKPVKKNFNAPQPINQENLSHSDGILVFTHGPLSEYLGNLNTYSLTHKTPFLHIDFNRISEKQAALRINLWVAEHVPKSVHVTGSTLEKNPRIYKAVYNTMYRTLALGREASSEAGEITSIKKIIPKTLEEAIQTLIDEIAVKDRVRIADMNPTHLSMLNIGLGRYIRNRFGLWAGNEALLKACAREEGLDAIHEDQASAIIIKRFAARLAERHKTRGVND